MKRDRLRVSLAKANCLLQFRVFRVNTYQDTSIRIDDGGTEQHYSISALYYLRYSTLGAYNLHILRRYLEHY